MTPAAEQSIPHRDHAGSGLEFLAGGGEMGALIRATDWSRTPVGPPETWSPVLRTVLRILLVNRFPMLLWWGPHYVQFYNDAYSPIPGAKHPASLGQSARDCWPEIWSILGPLIDRPFQGGPATWSEDLELEIHRAGFIEETHFTVAYSAVPDETAPGGIGGVLATVHEITQKVVGERRIVVLRDLGAGAAEAKTPEEACAIAAASLSKHLKDVPFALLYLSESDGHHARLAATAGLPPESPLRVPLVELDNHLEGSAPWPLSEVRRTHQLTPVRDLSSFGELPAGPWPHPPDSAVVLPIRSNIPHQLNGFLVAGLSSRLKFDGAYRDFLELANTQLSTAIANATAYQEERKRAEALAEIDRAKTAFFSNVSHEFRTPLTLMLGPLEGVLAKPDLPAEDREQLIAAHRNSLRLLKLVNSLLDFSRIEAGRVRASYDPVDLCALTTELASNFRSAMQAAGLQLIVECPPLSERVYVDREMWEKIVLNLLSNAFKFTFDGSVTVRLREAGNHAILTVADTGVGIPAHELPHIFERFHRVEGAKGRTYEGTGIGLALIQELVKLHGGTVTADSHLDAGSVFTVSIPFGTSHLPADRINAPQTTQVSTALRADAFTSEALTWIAHNRLENPSDEPVTPAPQDTQPSRMRILVVDDNADMREHVSRILGHRYKVVAVESAYAALDQARSWIPDLVLSDIMMPELDGFGLLRELRANPATRSVPVVFLSARAGEEASAEGREAGADDYIVKPFTARELLACVQGTLMIREERRHATEQVHETLQQAPVAICVLRRPDFVFELANPSFEKLLNTSHLIGRKLEEVLPTLPDAVWKTLRQVVDQGIPFLGSELSASYDSNGDAKNEDHCFNVACTPLHNPDQSIRGMIAVVNDVTQQVLARKEVERVNRELEEFAYVASHDIQEPLRMVNVYSQLLVQRMGKVAPEQSQRYVDFINTGVRRMEALIRDLLSFARTVQADSPDLTPVPLRDCLDKALDILRVPIEEKNAHIEIADLPVVLGDETQLPQLFQNLISNALKYAKPDSAPRIFISASRREKDWVVSVRDCGIGFKQEYAEHIFGLFKRLHKDEFLGTGLGLAICKRIVERCGGRIWAHSSPGEGAEFCFSLMAQA